MAGLVDEVAVLVMVVVSKKLIKIGVEMLKNKNRLLALVALAMALSQGFESCRASGSATPDSDSDGEVYFDALPLVASLVQQPGGSVAAVQKPAGSSGSDFDGDRYDDVSPAAVSRVKSPKKFQATAALGDIRLTRLPKKKSMAQRIEAIKQEMNRWSERLLDATPITRQERHAILNKEKELYEIMLHGGRSISLEERAAYRRSLHLAQQKLRLMEAEDVLARHGSSMNKQFRIIKEDERDRAWIEILKAEGTLSALDEAARIGDIVVFRNAQRQQELEEAAIAKRAAHMARIAAEEEHSGDAERLRQEAAARLQERNSIDAAMYGRIAARKKLTEVGAQMIQIHSEIKTIQHEIGELDHESIDEVTKQKFRKKLRRKLKHLTERLGRREATKEEIEANILFGSQ